MIERAVDFAAKLIWGLPTLFLFIGSGVFFSFSLGWLQIGSLPAAFRAIIKDLKTHAPDKGGGLSSVGALAASLGAVMGPGNLIGVSSAVIMGGAGAVFWMWVSAFLGMGVKYAESSVAVLYRKYRGGKNYGGPMYAMAERGYRKTAALFAGSVIFMSVAMANALPAGALGSALEASYGLPPVVTGAVLTVIALYAAFGGAERITKLSGVLVPSMCLFYSVAACAIIALEPGRALSAVESIFESAFSLKAGLGGLVGGAVRYGVARGIYSNEAGMGTEPILAAATSEKDPHRQGLISMTGPFLDTVVFCTFTAIVVLMYGGSAAGDASTMTAEAFTAFLPGAGAYIANATMAMLVMATMVTWSYYGEQAVAFFTESRGLRTVYRILYAAVPICSAGTKLDILFGLTDISTALIAVPNVILCIMLLSEIKKAREASLLSLTSVDKSGGKRYSYSKYKQAGFKNLVLRNGERTDDQSRRKHKKTVPEQGSTRRNRKKVQNAVSYLR